MSWNADAFFSIGKTHMICEDYALGGTSRNGLRYAIVSDGCSSSPQTDIGSRLLSCAVAHHVDVLSIFDEERVANKTLRSAAQVALMGLISAHVSPRALDTTLIVAYETEREGKMGTVVSMRGDGVVVARTREGHFTIESIDQLHNAPRYLSYDLEPDRLEGYVKKFGDKNAVRTYTSQEGWSPDPHTEFEGHPKDWFYDAETYDLVMVLSDGVHTFQELVTGDTSQTLVNVPVERVVEQLLQIKGTKGEFVKRRCHKFLTRHCVTHNWQHYDDFSAAAIWMENPNE